VYAFVVMMRRCNQQRRSCVLLLFLSVSLVAEPLKYLGELLPSYKRKKEGSRYPACLFWL
jgi:hypothetical protein